jgi:RND superfamily putative drug exporter
MHRVLDRLGGWSAAHPWRVLASWFAALVLAVVAAGALGGALHDDYNIPGTGSQQATELLREHFPAMSGASARVVVHGASTVPQEVLTAVGDELAHLPHVGTVTPPRMSADGDTALYEVTYTVPVTSFAGSAGVDALQAATAPATAAGLVVAFGGEVPENLAAPGGTAELVGIVAALLILLFALGSVVAAGLPLLVAILGLGIGTSLIGLLATVVDVSTTAPTVATMVGLGVGIDYALLMITRYREGLLAGLPVPAAAGNATATAGRSVLFAGTTVRVSLLGLKLSGLAVYESFGYATAIVVALMIAASLTLVPALCGIAKHRVLGRRTRRRLAQGLPVRETQAGPTATARWAALVGRRPWTWAVASLALLAALAAPVLGMRTWPQNAGSQPTTSTVRVAYDLIAAEYGPGANGPLLVAVDLGRSSPAAAERVRDRLLHHPGVVEASTPVVSPDGQAALISVEPAFAPDDDRMTPLVEAIRASDLPAGSEITGVAAVSVDIVDLLSGHLWWVIGFVVAMSVLLLMLVFRSLVVPLKAAAMNLLSVSAAFGVLVMLFQWGWGAELLGLPGAVPVSTWVPILMFAVLFGLSMDYEVFMLSRIREDWLQTGDAHGSVVRGLAATGRVITSCALIMVAVFVGFALDSEVTIKMIGVGMATAIAVDATLVRLVLVPATMVLLGEANWWLPRWLDRLLPHLGDPGDGHAVTDAVPEPALALIRTAVRP